MRSTVLLLLLLCCSGTPVKAQWIKTSAPSAHRIACMSTDGGKMYAGTYGGGILVSSDHGDSWAGFSQGLADLNVTSLLIKDTCIFAGTYAGSGGGVYLASGHSGWKQAMSWMSVYSHMDKFRGSNLVLCGGHVFASTGQTLYSSSDNGSTWKDVFNNGSCFEISINSLAVNDTAMFASVEGAVWQSLDKGVNWAWAGGGLPDFNGNSFCVLGNALFVGEPQGISLFSGGTATDKGLTGFNVSAVTSYSSFLFAGTDHGVFMSGNAGAAWTAINQGLTSLRITSLASDGTFLFAGTDSSGLWKILLADMVAVTGLVTNHAAASIGAVYPNPLSDRAVISYSTPKGTLKSYLRIYSSIGALSGTYEIDPNEAQVILSFTGLKSGIYFCSIENDGQVSSFQKVVVVH